MKLTVNRDNPTRLCFKRKRKAKRWGIAQFQNVPQADVRLWVPALAQKVPEKTGKFSVHFSDPCEKVRRTTENVCVMSAPKCKSSGKERKARSNLVVALA